MLKQLKALAGKAKGIRKALVAVLGVVAQVVAAGLLSGSLLHVAQAVLAAAAVGGVYGVANVKAAVVKPGPSPLIPKV